MAIWDGFVDWIRARIGRPRGVRIYFYVVRVSGYTIPPHDVRRKTRGRYNPKTPIQWEMSFEDRPFFRTTIANYKEAIEKHEPELRALVREQEKKAIEHFAFKPTIPIPSDQLSQSTINNFLLICSKNQEDEYNKTGDIFICGQPEFVISAIDFEPADFADVPRSRIREFKATDIYTFKLIRPEEDEAYQDWKGEWEHDL